MAGIAPRRSAPERAAAWRLAGLRPGAKGEIGDPVLLARKALRGLRAGDVVERGGYPAETGLVRVVRAGNVIGAISFDGDGRGGWFLAGSTLCGGLGTG